MKNYIFRFLPLAAFLLCAAKAFGQTPLDAVYLKSGESFEGLIIEQRPGDSIQLWRLSQNDTLAFAMEDIERITRTILPPEQPVLLVEQPLRLYRTKPNYVFASASAGGGDYPFLGGGLTLTHRLARYEKASVGLSVHYIGNKEHGYETNRVDFVKIIPLMLDLRHEFSRTRDNRFSTHVFADAGYAFNFTANSSNEYGEYEYGNGWIVHPGISFQFALLSDFGFFAEIGWVHHTSRRTWLPPVERTDIKAWNTILFRGGVFF